jgi:hypothetical protein
VFIRHSYDLLLATTGCYEGNVCGLDIWRAAMNPMPVAPFCLSRAQQPVMPLIGLLAAPNAASYAPYVDAFRQGARQHGQSKQMVR